MSARHKHRDADREEGSEVAVYRGRDLSGVMTWKRGKWIAQSAAGGRLGSFATSKEAGAAILDATRAAT